MRKKTSLKQWVIKLVGYPKDSPAPVPPMPMPELIQRLLNTQDVEWTCDEVHRVLDQFAEIVYRGEDAAQLMPLVQQHLDMCPDCREEFEAIMRVLHARSKWIGTT